MILIDSRVGSKHLAGLLGDKAILTQLEYGDACWSGNGGVTVGVEIKTVGDAVNCLYSGRLADHQIPGLRASYDVVYLIIEGLWRPEPSTGVLQYFKWFKSEKEVVCGKWVHVSSGQKRLMYQAFEMWLTSIEKMGGVSLRATPTSEATASLLTSLYNWFQRSDHSSFDTMHDVMGNGAALSRPTMLRRDLANLPHVGWERSGLLLPLIKGIRFIRRDGGVMSGEDWYIPNQIAEKSAEDIDRACDGTDG